MNMKLVSITDKAQQDHLTDWLANYWNQSCPHCGTQKHWTFSEFIQVEQPSAAEHSKAGSFLRFVPVTCLRCAAVWPLNPDITGLPK
jgi:hypothetical protein